MDTAPNTVEKFFLALLDRLDDDPIARLGAG